MIMCASNCAEKDFDNETVKQFCDFVQDRMHFRDPESLKRFLYSCKIPESAVQKSLAMF